MNEDPQDTSRSPSFMRFMGRHLVTLSGVADRFVSGEHIATGPIDLSGWVIELRHRRFWVTAGHCLRQLDEGIEDNSIQFLQTGFADFFGHEAVHNHMIPFSYSPGCGFYVDDGASGLDFGLIALDKLTVANMDANGVVPIRRENWQGQNELDFMHYKMMGIPSHLTEFQQSSDGEMNGGVRPMMLAIDRLEPTSIRNPPSDEWFVGRIASREFTESIVGMSGGPIFGFRQDSNGAWTYHVVALQSRWRESERVIFGCSVPMFAESLERTIDEFNQSDSAY